MRNARVLVLLLGAAALGSACRPAAAAYEFYVTIDGAKQGQFKGEAASTAHKDQIAGITIDYKVEVPVDRDSGLAAGTAQHLPVTFTKPMGAASPQIFKALTTNELLKSVQFDFVRRSADGAEQVYQTIKLTNAVVVRYRLYTPEGILSRATQSDAEEQEEVSLRFQRIEMVSRLGGTSASHEWQSGAREAP